MSDAQPLRCPYCGKPEFASDSWGITCATCGSVYCMEMLIMPELFAPPQHNVRTYGIPDIGIWEITEPSLMSFHTHQPNIDTETVQQTTIVFCIHQLEIGQCPKCKDIAPHLNMPRFNPPMPGDDTTDPLPTSTLIADISQPTITSGHATSISQKVHSGPLELCIHDFPVGLCPYCKDQVIAALKEVIGRLETALYETAVKLGERILGDRP